ncbi:MAG: lysylphosphatidylglycerol synthase domain-containing protein [Pseudomonadota bacterium]
MWRGRLLRLVLAAALSLACLAWLATRVDAAALAARLGAVDPRALALAFALTWLLPFWRAARLAAFVPGGHHAPRGTCWRIAAEALLWAFLLPFKLGELGLPVLLHRRLGFAPAAAAGLFLLVRLADFFVIAGLLACGAALVPGLGLAEGPRLLLALLGGALLLAPLLLAFLVVRGGAGLGHRLRVLAALSAGLTALARPAVRARLLLSSWAIWATHVLVAWTASAAAGVAPGPAEVLLASSAGNLAFALPVSGVLGLGPQQVAFAGALALGETDWSAATVAAIATYVAVLAGALSTGLTAWLWQAWSPGTPADPAKP